MFAALQQRIVVACLVTCAAGIVLVSLVAVAPRVAISLEGMLATGVVVLGAAWGIALAAARAALRPTVRSASELLDWSNSAVEAKHVAIPPLDPDLADFAWSYRALGVALESQLDTLGQERQRLQTILAGLESGVIVVDPAERVLLFNPTAGRLLGVDPAGALGNTVIDVARDHELTALTRAYLSGESPAASPVLLELGHPRRQVHVIASRIPSGAGHNRGVVILLQDVTELKQAEAVRREFVANVSHELRTPLAGLKALAETLKDGALGDPPAAQSFLDQMLLEVERLAQLVEELLELAQLESPEPALQRELLDLYQVVSAAADRARPRAGQAGAQLSVGNAPGPLEVEGDYARLERVFLNLIDNAVKFAPGGTVHVSLDRRDEEATVAVSDSGPGISEQDLPRVFERFYKADPSRASPGTGLGLAIVKHTVQRHGGRVWATSIQGKGSTFFVALPLARPEWTT